MSARTTQFSTPFERIPGQGFAFFSTSQPDARTKTEQKALAEKKPVPRISVWHGWLALPGGREVQVRALASSRTQEWSYTLHAFPQGESDHTSDSDAWQKLAEFKLPAFGDQKYVDGSFEFEGRTYRIRAIKGQPGEGFVRLRLPQVMNTKAAAAAMY